MQGVRANDLTWLCVEQQQRVPASEATKRRELATQFIHWLFDCYIIPLLQVSLQLPPVTDALVHLLRYRDIHYALRDGVLSPHIVGKHHPPSSGSFGRDFARGAQRSKLPNPALTELTIQEEAEEALKSPLGVSAIRLIPKPKGFRPIVNMGKRVVRLASSYALIQQRTYNAFGVAGVSGKLPSANDVLKDVQLVLTYEKVGWCVERSDIRIGGSRSWAPVSLGQTRFSLPSRASRRSSSTTTDDCELTRIQAADARPKLHFAMMDIKGAFDSIKHDKLLHVMGEFLDKVSTRHGRSDSRTTTIASHRTAFSYLPRARRRKRPQGSYLRRGPRSQVRVYCTSKKLTHQMPPSQSLATRPRPWPGACATRSSSISCARANSAARRAWTSSARTSRTTSGRWATSSTARRRGSRRARASAACCARCSIRGSRPTTSHGRGGAARWVLLFPVTCS